MKVTELNIEQTKGMLIHVADAIIESKPYLTETDQKIGDGDHGIGMAGGMDKAKAALSNGTPAATINDLMKAVGMSMIGSMGGASGVIFGTMFAAAAKTAPAQTLTPGILSTMIAASLAEIKKLGKAEPGDKTMVDALQPAAEALAAHANEPLSAQLESASKAAEDGLEKTKSYVAKFGRAKSLMERSIGYQDAGATSVSIIFKAMYDYVYALEAGEQ
jgi:dihydroxyacetone kinase phosphoprotein-dependent L subunit